MTEDTYFKKEIIYPFQGEKFVFSVAETLFSTFDIDHGTDILIRNIVTNNPKTLLDLGCGYGPIGIILAKKNPGGELWVVVVNALNRLIPKVGRQDNLHVKEIKKRHGHTVYRIRKNS